MFAVASIVALQVSGDAVIRGRTSDSEIVITTTSRLAGAIHSLKWRGKEFIDSTDHGRQLQSAANFDHGTPIAAETYNPTEAGSRQDGAGPTSSSRLLSLTANGNRLTSNCQMAFWLAPGETSGSNLAKNSAVLSHWFLYKEVTIGALGRPQLIEYRVTFAGHPDEQNNEAVFESLTGYMPAEFSSFYRFDAKSAKLEPLSDGPGEQPDPVVLSTPDGDFAMGIYSPEKARKGYGRWRFGPEKVVKWNCVFRVQQPQKGAWFSYLHYVAVGTREQVAETLKWLSSSKF